MKKWWLYAQFYRLTVLFKHLHYILIVIKLPVREKKHLSPAVDSIWETSQTRLSSFSAVVFLRFVPFLQRVRSSILSQFGV